MSFSPLSNKVHFPDLENEVQGFWDKHDTFQKSLAARKAGKSFVFYDGPPFATGLPHFGNLLAGTIKDIIPRYQTMKGHYVERRFGWDCHGLPIEMEIQKELGLMSNADIEKHGVAKFNETCRSVVLRYTHEWEKTVRRIGRWVDFKNDYKTMNLSFMESVWWVFKSLFEKGLIYEGFKVLPYSWASGTPLSNFEANLNYKDVQDPAITIRFECADEPNTFILAWTTTPWTLISNLALCVNESLDYVKYKNLSNGSFYYIGASRLAHYLKEGEYEIVAHLKGKDLKGKKYRPLFPYAIKEIDTSKCYVVLADDYVTDTDGTGIVHQAPAYGEDDQRVCQAAGIGVYDPVDGDGNFKKQIDFIAAKNIKEADKDIIRHLKEAGLLFKHEVLQHSYPYCWRTDTPLMYKAISTWFVRVEKVREQMVADNQKIHWVPGHVGEGRFGNWLEGARDWAISRNRYWGTPIPVWKAEDGEILCVGSVDELEKLSGKKFADIHKHFVDDAVLEKNGKKYKRVTEVLDCWFESGSMPYAQNHYPFENKEFVENHFPADFIAEGLDQTRGWFYTLVVLGSSLFAKPPFRNVIVNGLILAEDGKKMSKRLKNYPDPSHIFETYGADALRLYMISSAVVKGESLRFSENGVKEILKTILIPLWNSFTFFVNYASIDKWEASSQKEISPKDLTNPLDRWILSYSEKLLLSITESMDAYDLQKAVPPILEFIDRLTNWYIRRSRRRFWKSENDGDKNQAYQTLYAILIKLAKISAPFTPFIAEKIYGVLRTPKDPESVHLANFPVYRKEFRDEALEREMELVESTISLGRNLRISHSLRIRQPLSEMVVVCAQKDSLAILKKHAEEIEDELNIKKVSFSENESELVTLQIKPNFKVLGKKVGPKMKEVGEKLSELGAPEIAKAEAAGKLEIEISSGKLSLVSEDFQVIREEKSGQAVASQNGVTVLLKTELSPALVEEGVARDFVNLIQKKRKDLDLAYTDRIKITCQSDANENALKRFDDYIRKETLAEIVGFAKEAGPGFDEEELGSAKSRFRVEKV